MREKKMNRVLLYLIGFMCGHSAIFGMNPFLVPAFAAVFYMRQSTFGLLVSMFLGGASLYAKNGWIRNRIFETGPYVMGLEPVSVGYFLSKYITIGLAVLISLNLFETMGRGREHAKEGGNQKKWKKREKSVFSYEKYITIAVVCGCLIFIASAIWGRTIYNMRDAYILAACEAVLSVSLIPVFRRGFQVLLRNERERDKYNEELLGVLVVVAACFWGMPVTIGGVVIWLEMCGFYISWYTLHRFGAGYGMAVTGVCGLIVAVKTGNPEYVGSFFIIAVLVLAGRVITDKKKLGTIISAAAATVLVGLFYYNYFLTPDGIKTAGSAIALFAATPKWLLSIKDGWINTQYNAETATEINRITAEKIRELSGAFKRIEYTLAGCGPTASKVSLGEIGDMIGRFSDNLETAEPVSVNNEELLRAKFLEQGVILTHLSSMKNERNHRQYYITAKTKNKKIMLSKDAADIMSEVFDQPVRVSEDAPAIISENDHVITFEECAKYRCTYYVRRIKKYGSNVSGDNFSVKEHENGRLVMMISDGMGSGSLASCESTLMIDTMEELLDAGFEPSYGISFSNDCISEKNNGRCFTTFDMGILDLYDGSLVQYKQGAAPTYILHAEDDTEILRGESLPIGVLPQAECDVIKTNLQDEDIVVMVSDGALGNGEDLTDILEDIASDDCKEILDQIVSGVLCRCEGKLEDDVTVIVARLEDA